MQVVLILLGVFFWMVILNHMEEYISAVLKFIDTLIAPMVYL